MKTLLRPCTPFKKKLKCEEHQYIHTRFSFLSHTEENKKRGNIIVHPYLPPFLQKNKVLLFLLNVGILKKKGFSFKFPSLVSGERRFSTVTSLLLFLLTCICTFKPYKFICICIGS